MPDYKLEKDVVIHLILTEGEARYLRELTQNAPHPGLSNELAPSTQIRCSIFSVLKEALDAV